MIIDKTYFKGEIYLPYIRSNISDEVSSEESDVLEFINDYSREVLLRSLGTTLFIEFESQLDDQTPTGLIAGSPEKWNKLLNGSIYVDKDGNDRIWRGIRYKSMSNGNYDRSFIANYVYFFFESNSFITRSGIGNQIEQGANSESIVPNQKVSKAWNKFVSNVQGNLSRGLKLGLDYRVIQRRIGLGIDYWLDAGGQDASLYQFIDETNEVTPDTYANFNGEIFEELNQFGI